MPNVQSSQIQSTRTKSAQAQSSQVDSRAVDSQVVNALATIGAQLRQAREAEGLSIDEAARATRIRPLYLEELERGNLAQLPEPVYVRGFIQHYGNYVGVNGDALATEFARIVLPAIASTKPAPKPKIVARSAGLRPVHAWAAYVGLIVAAVFGVSQFWDRNSTGQFQTAANPPTPAANPEAIAPLSEPLFSSPEKWIAIDGLFPSTSQVVAAADPSSERVKLGIQIIESPSWMRVVADRKTVFEGTLQPGSKQEWKASDSILVRVGNAGGVKLTVNDKQLGTMGALGEVRQQEFSRTSLVADNSQPAIAIGQ
jgi:cytoskeletal protein RodZ